MKEKHSTKWLNMSNSLKKITLANLQLLMTWMNAAREHDKKVEAESENILASVLEPSANVASSPANMPEPSTNAESSASLSELSQSK